MTTPPTPQRLRELARNLEQAATDLGRAMEVVDDTCTSLTLHAGTRHTYDPEPAPVAAEETRQPHDLPEGSLVAVGPNAFRLAIHYPGSPYEARTWIPTGDGPTISDSVLKAKAEHTDGGLHVLRVGYDGYTTVAPDGLNGRTRKHAVGNALRDAYKLVERLGASGLHGQIMRHEVLAALRNVATDNGVTL